MHNNDLFTLRTVVAIGHRHQAMDEEHGSEDHLGSGLGHDDVSPGLPRPHDVSMMSAVLSCPVLLLLSSLTLWRS